MAVLIALRESEQPFAVYGRALVDHGTRGLEGLIVERAEPVDRREARFDRPYPQRGEALGTECLQRCGAQGVPVDVPAAGGSNYRVDEDAAGATAELRHALLFDEVLCGLASCAGGTGSISASPGRGQRAVPWLGPHRDQGRQPKLASASRREPPVRVGGRRVASLL